MALAGGMFGPVEILDRLPGLDLHFQLRLLVSLERGWLWDTMTIKTHVPTYEESLVDHALSLFISVLTHWYWDSLSDFIQVWLKLWTQEFLSSELLRESTLRTYIRPTLHATFQEYSPLSSTYHKLLELNQLTTLLPLLTDRGAHSEKSAMISTVYYCAMWTQKELFMPAVPLLITVQVHQEHTAVELSSASRLFPSVMAKEMVCSLH